MNVELLAKVVLLGIRGRNVQTVIDTLNKVQAPGISLSTHLDDSAMNVIAKECCRMVTCGHIEDAVELMEVLARNFSIFRSLFLVMLIHPFCLFHCFRVNLDNFSISACNMSVFN